MNKISAVYKIVNEKTGDFYIGSSKNVKRRWKEHKKPSTWKNQPNSPMYQDMEKYGIGNFRFQILAPVMPEHLTQVEQDFIEMLKPTYNRNRAKGQDTERLEEYLKEYWQSDKGKEIRKKAEKKYFDQLCKYNGKTLKLNALIKRFQRSGVENPTLEAKKYLVKTS